jgi:hypothetical protein
VYFFPRKKEISQKDTQIDFEAKMGRFAVHQNFDPSQMLYHGKLEL